MASFNIAASNALLDKMVSDYSAAKLRIYGGVIPSGGDSALDNNALCAEHDISGFDAPSNRLVTAGSIADAAVISAGQTIGTFARLEVGSLIIQLSLGTSNAELIVDSTTYINGGVSRVTSLTIYQAEQ